MISVCLIAGGKGTRSNDPNLPKSLQLIGGVPLIVHQLSVLNRSRCKVTLVLNFKAQDIITELQKYHHLFTNLIINFIVETQFNGTLGAYKNFQSQTNDEYSVIILGDLFFDLDVKRIFDYHALNKLDLTIVTHPNNHPKDSDQLSFEVLSNTVRNFHSKDLKDDKTFQGNSAVAGIFLVRNSRLSLIPHKSGDISRDLVPFFIDSNLKVLNWTTINYVKDSGTPERLIEINAYFEYSRNNSQHQKLSCIFLDLDGTFIPNQEVKLKLSSDIIPDETKLMVKEFNKRDIPIIIFTNQPGLAKNFFSVMDLNEFINCLQFELSKHGAFVNDWFICPHHPEVGWDGENKNFKTVCNCRKPKPGLFLEAQIKHALDFNRCVYLGNELSDESVARSLGIRYQPVLSPQHLPASLSEILVAFDHN
jgi:mannose-1-phosphate guanylyltransferase/phosphomannomutase